MKGFPTLATLCSLLREANGRVDHAQTYLLSAVEEMGTLRILVTGRNPHANGWIRFAERHATHTCEICGENGRPLYLDGWQRVRWVPHTLSIRPFEEDEE